MDLLLANVTSPSNHHRPADVFRAGPEEGATAPDTCRQDNRCHRSHYVSHCLCHFPHLLLHPLQGILIGAGSARAVLPAPAIAAAQWDLPSTGFRGAGSK